METGKSLIPVPPNFKPSSFWAKPEGTTGMVILGTIAAAIGIFALPWLLTLVHMFVLLLANIYVAVGLAVGLAILYFVLTSSRTWTLAKCIFKSISRKITYKWIGVDPFGTFTTCRDSVKELYDSFSNQVDALHGKKAGLKRVIETNAKEQETAANTANAAESRHDEKTARIQRRQFMRLKGSNERLAKVFRLMEILETALRKYQDKCDEVVQDLDNEIQVGRAEYQALEVSYSAIETAKKILAGGTDEWEVMAMTREYLAQNYEAKVGAIEGFLEQSQGMIASFDLQRAVDDEAAIKAIEEWTKKGDQLLLEHLPSHSGFMPDLSVPGLDDESKTPDYVSLLNQNER